MLSSGLPFNICSREQRREKAKIQENNWIGLMSRVSSNQGQPDKVVGFAIYPIKLHEPLAHARLPYSRGGNHHLIPDLTSSPFVLVVEFECPEWEMCLLRTE